MAQPAFDTLTVAQTLEREYDYSPKQAEGAARMLFERTLANVATKDDLDRVVSDLKSEIGSSELRTTIRLGSIMAAGIFVLGALVMFK